MLPIILGGIALVATGYGVKKYMDNNDEFYDKATGWMESTANSLYSYDNPINSFFRNVDSMLSDNKESITKDSIDRYDELYDGFYTKAAPYFLETFGDVRGLPDFEIKAIEKLQEKTTNDNLSNITDEAKENLTKYNALFSQGVYALLKECQEIRALVQDNSNYDEYTKSSKNRIKDSYSLFGKLIDIYYMAPIDAQGKLSNEFISALKEVEAISEELI